MASGVSGRAERPIAIRRAWRLASRRVGVGEATIGPALASAILLPAALGSAALVPAYLLLIAAAGWSALRRGRLVPIPWLLVAYLGIYALAAIHGGDLGPAEANRYLIRPLIALAVAVIAATAVSRGRVLALIVVIVAVEVPVTAFQAVGNVLAYGRGATTWADAVTGTLGAWQAGVVTLTAVAAATLIGAMWLSGRLGGRRALLGAALLCSVGVFSATRAIVGFVPAAALGISVVAATFGSTRPRLRRLVALPALAFAAVPLFYAATIGIYPEAWVGAVSSQRTDVLGGAAAQGLEQAPSGPPGTLEPAPPGPPEPAQAPTGVQLLPGRVKQIETALRISVADGPAVALLGRGLGASELDPSYRVSYEVPLPQRTGPTWVGRVLTDSGWLGLGAFAGLLLWLAWLGRWLWPRVPPRSADRAIAAALPGIAALTAVGGLFTTILDVRGYSFVFWVLVGLAISAAHEARAHPLSEPPSPAGRQRSLPRARRA